MIARRRRQPRTTILDAIADPHLFGQHFQDQQTWAAWFVFLCALFALPMTPEQLTKVLRAYRVIKGAFETPHYKAAPGNESSGRDGCKMIRHQSQIVAVGELRGAPKKLVRGLSPELNPKNVNVSTQSAAVATNDREQK